MSNTSNIGAEVLNANGLAPFEPSVEEPEFDPDDYDPDAEDFERWEFEHPADPPDDDDPGDHLEDGTESVTRPVTPPKPLNRKGCYTVTPSGEVASDIRSAINRHLILGPGYAEAATLWVIHAHCLEASDYNPRLHLRSPTWGCGKTTLANLLRLLTGPNSHLSSNCSHAAFFRLVDKKKKRITMLIDEADQFISEARKDALSILNSGHYRPGAYVTRCDGDNHEPREFSTWCPLVIASIGPLPAVLESRSIVIDLERMHKGETVEKVTREHVAEYEKLAGRIATWVKDNIEALTGADPEIPDSLPVGSRARDNWRPLIAIADRLGGDWPRLAREAAARVTDEPDLEEQGVLVMLLEDIRAAFGTRDKIKGTDLLNALNKDDERPWPTFDRGQRMTNAQLLRHLRMIKVGPKPIRIDTNTVRGYERKWFEDAWDRYLPQEPSPNKV
jgi:hypothetical protein